MRFGEFVKEKRIKKGLTLRNFCKNNDLDAGNVSRIENGVSLPPENPEKLTALATALGISEGSSDWERYFDLAAAEKRELPEDLKSKENMMEFLPAFYRTLRKKDLTESDLNEIIKIIKG